MVPDDAPDKARPAWVKGTLVTLAAILASEGLAHTAFLENAPVRGALFGLVVVALAYAAFVGGLRVGLANAALTSAYALYYYPRWVTLLPDPRGRLLLALSVCLVCFSLATLVGLLKTRYELANARVLALERAHLRETKEKNRALAQANEALEAFAYLVSHDLKEPVRALHAYSQSLLEDHAAALPGEARELARRNVETSERLGRLLTGLLDYSRATHAALDVAPLRVEDALRAEDFLARVDHSLRERGARLDVEPGPPVLATMPLLSQILGNLVLNAVRHNPRPAPRVRVRAAPFPEDASLVEVVVEDDGPGFPAALRERFDDASRPPPAPRGGFGLLIARRGIERLGGRLSLSSSAELGGAAVRFTLPAAQGPR